MKMKNEASDPSLLQRIDAKRAIRVRARIARESGRSDTEIHSYPEKEIKDNSDAEETPAVDRRAPFEAESNGKPQDIDDLLAWLPDVRLPGGEVKPLTLSGADPV